MNTSRSDSKQPVAGDIVLRKGKKYLVSRAANGELMRQEMHVSGSGRTLSTAYRLWKDRCYRILPKQISPESDAFAEAQAAGLLPDMDTLAQEQN